MDVGEEDRLFWLTGLGWLMGPMALTAALFHGGTAVVFEGVTGPAAAPALEAGIVGYHGMRSGPSGPGKSSNRA